MLILNTRLESYYLLLLTNTEFIDEMSPYASLPSMKKIESVHMACTSLVFLLKC